MPKLTDFLAELPEPKHVALAGALSAALYHAQQAAYCLTDADQDPRHETVAQLLAYLSTAIERLQVACGIVRQRA
jgi:hypothetical protein